MSSLSPLAPSWRTGGQHPGHSSLSRLRPQFPPDSHVPISELLPNTPCSPFRSIRMGCGRDRRLGKPAASGRDDGGAPGSATVSALHPRPPPPSGISQALTCTDPGQSPSPPPFLCCRPAGPRGNGELILRREQRPEQEGLLHTSALGHVRPTSSTNSGPQFPLPPAVRQKRARPCHFPPP